MVSGKALRFFCCVLQVPGCEPVVSDYKAQLLTSEHKNKKHYTPIIVKRCIYKAKSYFCSSDINCTYITMKIE